MTGSREGSHHSEAATLPPRGDDERNQRLVEQMVEIASLAGGLAHEIKNPLSTIRLNLDLLVEDWERSDNPRDRRALQKIHVIQQQCRHLQEILDDFLRFAQVRDPHLERADLNEVLEDLVDFYLPQAVQHHIEIVRYLDSDLPAVRLDRELFKHALLNLFLNAQQAMPEGGQLVLKTASGDGSVMLEVIDTGRGMDAEALERLFQPFYTTRAGGTGLGLPTTRRIVHAHAGTVDVESEPGKGTRFVITLPVAQD